MFSSYNLRRYITVEVRDNSDRLKISKDIKLKIPDSEI